MAGDLRASQCLDERGVIALSRPTEQIVSCGASRGRHNFSSTGHRSNTVLDAGIRSRSKANFCCAELMKMILSIAGWTILRKYAFFGREIHENIQTCGVRAPPIRESAASGSPRCSAQLTMTS